jgi:hypothetical protein
MQKGTIAGLTMEKLLFILMALVIAVFFIIIVGGIWSKVW